MAAEFCTLDSNDKWVSHCGRKLCSKDHNIRVNSVMFNPNTMDMNYVEFQRVVECYPKERKFYCKFFKMCKSCQRFKRLCCELETIMLNSCRKSGGYVTAVRFCSKNFRYPKTLCITVDILVHRSVSKKFVEKIEEKEKPFYRNVVNAFRSELFW